MESKRKPDLKVTELFMAQGCGKRFIGTIQRYNNLDGSEFVVGRVTVNDHEIIARASDQWELGNRLDQLTLLVLDYNLNQMPAHMIEYAGVALFLN